MSYKIFFCTSLINMVKNAVKPTYGVGCVVDYGQEQQWRQCQDKLL
jgi:hypothetical protein